MQPVECAVIAAAGLGSRLGHGLPKCMLEIGGKPLLTRLIETLRPLIPRIHVVIGYREEMIIDLCAREHRDVVLVRNPKYRETNTGESMALGARGCGYGVKVLFLDGDLLINPESLGNFVQAAAESDLLIGITPAQSEDAVCVELTDSFASSGPVVTGFTRSALQPFEWANIVAGPNSLMNEVSGYVFERLRDYLPSPAFALDLREVDTSSDLERAKQFAVELDKGGKSNKATLY